jgi:hypothetical protein
MISLPGTGSVIQTSVGLIVVRRVADYVGVRAAFVGETGPGEVHYTLSV